LLDIKAIQQREDRPGKLTTAKCVLEANKAVAKAVLCDDDMMSANLACFPCHLDLGALANLTQYRLELLRLRSRTILVAPLLPVLDEMVLPAQRHGLHGLPVWRALDRT